MSKLSYAEYSEVGWRETELEMKRQLVAQDERFRQAMRAAIVMGLERVSEVKSCN